MVKHDYTKDNLELLDLEVRFIHLEYNGNWQHPKVQEWKNEYNRKAEIFENRYKCILGRY